MSFDSEKDYEVPSYVLKNRALTQHEMLHQKLNQKKTFGDIKKERIRAMVEESHGRNPNQKGAFGKKNFTEKRIHKK